MTDGKRSSSGASRRRRGSDLRPQSRASGRQDPVLRSRASRGPVAGPPEVARKAVVRIRRMHAAEIPARPWYSHRSQRFSRSLSRSEWAPLVRAPSSRRPFQKVRRRGSGDPTAASAPRTPRGAMRSRTPSKSRDVNLTGTQPPSAVRLRLTRGVRSNRGVVLEEAYSNRSADPHRRRRRVRSGAATNRWLGYLLRRASRVVRSRSWSWAFIVWSALAHPRLGTDGNGHRHGGVPSWFDSARSAACALLPRHPAWQGYHLASWCRHWTPLKRCAAALHAASIRLDAVHAIALSHASTSRPIPPAMINATPGRSEPLRVSPRLLGGLWRRTCLDQDHPPPKPPAPQGLFRLGSGRSGGSNPSSALKETPARRCSVYARPGSGRTLLSIWFEPVPRTPGWSRTLGETLGRTLPQPPRAITLQTSAFAPTDMVWRPCPIDRQVSKKRASDSPTVLGRLLLEEVTAVREGRDFRVRDVCRTSGHGLRYVRKQPFMPPVDEANWQRDRLTVAERCPRRLSAPSRSPPPRERDARRWCRTVVGRQRAPRR